MNLLPSLALALSLAAAPPVAVGPPGLKHRLTGHTSTVRGAAFSPDGKTLATVGDDGQLRVWDVRTGKSLVSVKRPTGFGSVEYSRDGTQLLTAGTDGVVRLWDAALGLEKRALAGHTGAVYVACFTPDARYIVSSGIETLTRVWEAGTGKLVRTLPSGTCYALAISPDGKQAVTAGAKQELTLWDLATGSRVREMAGHRGVVVWLTFSPDGRTIASASYDHTTRLWETSTGKQRVSVHTAANSPRVLMFSRDGRSLAEGNYDSGARLYDSGTGKELFLDKGLGGSLYAVALSPDGRYLCGGAVNGRLQVWDVWALTARRLPTGTMPAAAFHAHWNALASEDAAEAYRAIVALAAPGALAHIEARLRPAKPVDADALKRAPQLLRDLEDDEKWKKAADELARLGPAIVGVLKQALAKAEDADVKLRLIVTMGRADVTGSDELRLLRGIEALERLGSPGAVKVLEALAAGGRGKTAAREARASLARLKAVPCSRP
jgi:WD40 repeat protein